MTIYGPDLETEGTDPFAHSIITIQYRDGDTETNHLYKCWRYDREQDLIFDFLMDYKDIRWVRNNGGQLRVGYGVTGFDLPFLLVRSFETDLFERLRAGPGFFWTNVLHGPSYLDLSQLLGADMASFEAWRGELLNTASPSGGEEIPHLYKQGEYEQIEDYVTDELEAMEALYVELKSTEYFTELMEMRRNIGFDRALE